jgi:hypothetical protein
MGTYDHHPKYQGVFPDLLENTFFIRVPLWIKAILNEFKEGNPYEKSVLQKVQKHTRIFFEVIIGTHTNWKMQ